MGVVYIAAILLGSLLLLLILRFVGQWWLGTSDILHEQRKQTKALEQLAIQQRTTAQILLSFKENTTHESA